MKPEQKRRILYNVGLADGSPAHQFYELHVRREGRQAFGPEVAYAANNILEALLLGQFRSGEKIDLADDAVRLRDLLANHDLRYLWSTAKAMVHPIMVDEGRDPETRREEREWRDRNIWLFGATGLLLDRRRRARAVPHDWHFLLAIRHVPGFTTGDRPAAPNPYQPPPVEIFDIRHLGFGLPTNVGNAPLAAARRS